MESCCLHTETAFVWLVPFQWQAFYCIAIIIYIGKFCLSFFPFHCMAFPFICAPDLFCASQYKPPEGLVPSSHSLVLFYFVLNLHDFVTFKFIIIVFIQHIQAAFIVFCGLKL